MNDQAEAILSVVVGNPSITQKELARILGVTERTISREVKKLRQAGILRRMGSDRKGHWVIQDPDAA